jgi:hypothetical protein
LLDGDFEEDGEGAELSSEDAGHDATHNHEVGLSGDEEPA